MLLLFFAGSAFAQTTVTGCQTLATANDTYVLANDVNVTSGNCFIINAAGITFDAQNHLINGPGKTVSSLAFYVNSGGSPSINNISITNATVQNFMTAVRVNSPASGVSITNNSFKGNKQAVFMISGSTNYTVTGNSFQGNDYEFGVSSSIGINTPNTYYVTVTGNISGNTYAECETPNNFEQYFESRTFCQGTFPVSYLSAQRNGIVLTGNNTVLQGNGANMGFMLQVNGSNSTIQNFALENYGRAMTSSTEFSGSNFTVTNNVFRNNNVAFGPDTKYNAGSHSVTGNTFENNNYDLQGIYGALIADGGYLGGTITGNTYLSCDVPKVFEQYYESRTFCSGTFDTNSLKVYRPITLTGNNSTLKGNGKNAGITVNVYGNNSTIEGITFDGYKYAITSPTDYGINALTVRNNAFRNNVVAYAPDTRYAAGTHSVTGNTFENNNYDVQGIYGGVETGYAVGGNISGNIYASCDVPKPFEQYYESRTFCSGTFDTNYLQILRTGLTLAGNNTTIKGNRNNLA
ncbi:hypothetical protein HZB89_02330, partial [archaeon]|nr:hypothetical protein [archaeon]